jgi:hypothetical protein
VTDLVSKIITRFQGDTTLDDISGPFWGRSKDANAFPHCVLSSIPGGQPVHLFAPASGTDFIVENQLIQFSIYHTDLVTLSGYQTALHARFDKCSLTLTVSGDTHLSALRRASDIIVSPTLSSDTLTVYHAWSRYMFQWQNNL